MKGNDLDLHIFSSRTAKLLVTMDLHQVCFYITLCKTPFLIIAHAWVLDICLGHNWSQLTTKISTCLTVLCLETDGCCQHYSTTLGILDWDDHFCAIEELG
jgi:hypothetical protein